MPLEPAASTTRPWVAIYVGGAAPRAERAARHAANDPPPSYEEAMGTSAPAPRLLPPSRAVPVAVANGTPAWRPFSRTPHPEVQLRNLQKALERRERTERKLDVARDHLDEVLRDHEYLSPNYCGSGLFDEECGEINHARRKVAHYVKKRRALRDAHEEALRRDAGAAHPRLSQSRGTR